MHAEILAGVSTKCCWIFLTKFQISITPPCSSQFNCFTLSQCLSTVLHFFWHFPTVNVIQCQLHFHLFLKEIPSHEWSNTWSCACQHQHPECYQDHYLRETFQLTHPTWKYIAFLRKKHQTTNPQTSRQLCKVMCQIEDLPSWLILVGYFPSRSMQLQCTFVPYTKTWIWYWRFYNWTYLHNLRNSSRTKSI